MAETVSDADRKVWAMFDRIAPRYDLLNRLLSLGQDVRWRRSLARHLPPGDGLRLLDLATGTADQILMLLDRTSAIREAVGLDMAEAMLEQGRRKLNRRGLSGLVRLQQGDAAHLPFGDGGFDVITMSFGIRNVSDVSGALREMRRVLKPGGRALILEFSLPAWKPARALYLGYFRNVLPRIGGWISGDRQAYRYLNRTVESFPYGEEFLTLMRRAGFTGLRLHPLTFGIATIYQGERT